MNSSWLSYFNLSDEYERRARFLPAVLSLLPLTPLVMSVGLDAFGLIGALLAGTGIAAVLSVGLSHMASACGNRLQRSIWPRWPHDSPTNLWLRPSNTHLSQQQKKLLYDSIKRLTALDIEAVREGKDNQQIELVINDAVARLRNRLWGTKEASRLRIHNIDYGFTRNLTGLRPVWITLAALSFVVCWVAYFKSVGSLGLAVFSLAAGIIALILAYPILPKYTQETANRYAESFLSAILEFDANDRAS